MQVMSIIAVNAVRCATSPRAYQPEKVLSTVLRMVPDLDNTALHMILRACRYDAITFDCPHSAQVCEHLLEELEVAVAEEMERRQMMCMG